MIKQRKIIKYYLQKKNNENSAITLISLVVTIIILIILAGVSINLTLGENGIITKAKQAKENTDIAKEEEQRALNSLYDEIIASENGNIESFNPILKLEEYKKKIAKAITNQKVETSSEATTETMVENIGKILKARTSDATATAEYIANGKTAYIDGEKIIGNGEKYDIIELKGRYYLYNTGNMYDEITGGWKKLYNSGTSSIENSDNYITLKTSGVTDFIISNSINLSEYKMLYFEFEVDKINNTFFGIRNTDGSTSNQFSRADYGLTDTITNAKGKYVTLNNGHYLVKINLGNIERGFITIEGNSNTIKLYSVYLK